MANYRSKRQARRAPKSGRLKTPHSLPAWLWLLTGMFVGILGATTTYMISTEKWTLPSSKKASPSAALDHEIDESKTKPKASGAPSSTNHKTPEITQRFEFYHLLPGMEVPIPDSDYTGIPGTASQSSKWNSENPKITEKNENKSAPLAKPAALASKPLSITPAKAVAVTPKPITPEISATPQKTTIPTSPMAPVVRRLNKAEQPATQLGSMDPTLIQPKAVSSNSNLPQVQRKLAAAQYLIQVSAFRTANQAEELKARLVLQGFRPHIQKVRIQDNIWFRVTLGPFSTETMALKQKKQLEKHQIRGILFLQR